jgi:Mitochondrial carrier protein
MGEISHFFCGSVAGMVTSCVVQPLDVIKTNVLTISKPIPISKSFNFVYKQYGLQGFWRGLRPSAYKSFLSSGMTFYSIEAFKSFFPKNESKVNKFIHDSMIAVFSRMITSLTLSPLSVIKVRMEAPQSNPYKNVLDGMAQIYKEEGVKGYYSGIGPALLRDLPFSAIAYAFYNQYYMIIQGVVGYSSYNSMISGGLSGFTATLITQPFDIIKTRNQFSHIAKSEDHKYKNILHAAKTIYKKEGLIGFTIGLKIRIIERTLAFSTVWYIYETLKRELIQKNHK